MAQSSASGAAGVTTRSAVNVQRASLWSNDNPWIDLCKRGGPWFELRGATVRRDGWLQDLQPGGTASFRTHQNQDAYYGFIPTGRYVATNTQGVTMEFVGPAAGDSVAGANRATCIVADSTHPPAQGNFGIRITNRTGAPIALFDSLRIFREQDEAALRAGEIWRPEKIAALGNAAVVRTMPLTAPNVQGEDRYELDQPGFLALPGQRSYVENGHVPYAACANLAASAGRDLWICFPYCIDSLRYELDAQANRVYPLRNRRVAGRFTHGWPEGTQLCFPHEGRFSTETGIPADIFLYVRNPDAEGFQLSTTRTGPVDVRINLTTGRGKGYSYVTMSRVFTEAQLLDHFRAIAAQVKSAYNSTGRIFVEAGNEPWNNGFRQTPFIRGYFSQLAGTWKDGTLQQRAGGGNAWLSLLAWKAMLEHFPRSRLVFVLNGQAAWWDRLGGKGGMFDYVDPGLVMPGRRVADIVDEYAVAPYTAPRNIAAGRSYKVADFQAERAATQPDAWWTERFLADTTRLAADSMRKSVTNVKAKNPAIRVTTYETGQHIWEEVGQMSPENLALTLRAHRYLSGPAGAAMFQDHYQRVHADFGATLYNHFTDTEGWHTKRFVNGGWGLRPHSDAASNARFEWFNSLPGKPVSIGAPVARVHALGIAPDGAAVAAQPGARDWTQRIADSWGVESRRAPAAGLAGVEAAGEAGGDAPTHLLLAGPPDLLAALQHRHLAAAVLARAESLLQRWPGAQPLLWHAWNPGDRGLGTATFRQYVAFELKMQKCWDAVTEAVNLAAARRGHAWRLANLPAAYCVARLVDHACNDLLPGINAATTEQMLAMLAGGPGCAGGAPDITGYYLELVRMSALHRRCPIGAWHPDSLDARQATSLQQLCWTALLDYCNWYEWKPTMAQARAWFSGDVDLSARDYLGAGDWSSRFFAEQDPASGNPFAAHDEN